MNIKRFFSFFFFLFFFFFTQELIQDKKNHVSYQEAKPENIKSEKYDKDTVSLIFQYMKVILISEFKSPREMQEDWIRRHKKRPSKYIGIGFGVSGFLNTKTGINFEGEMGLFNLDYSKSVHIQVNFFAYKFRLTSDWGLSTGLGFNFDHFVFQTKNKDFVFTSSVAQEQNITSLDPSRNNQYKKYSLNTVDFHLPLLLEWAPIKNRFRVATGFTFSYLISKRLARKYEDPDFGLIKQVRRDKLDFNSFQVMTTTEVGYRFLTFYFEYGLLNMFSSSPYNQVHPFHLGLRLNL
jgi:hypothetical protein